MPGAPPPTAPMTDRPPTPLPANPRPMPPQPNTSAQAMQQAVMLGLREDKQYADRAALPQQASADRQSQLPASDVKLSGRGPGWAPPGQFPPSATPQDVHVRRRGARRRRRPGPDRPEEEFGVDQV